MRALAVFLLLLLPAQALRAEKYLSRAETEKLCFPGADRFEQQVLRFDKQTLNRIKQSVGSSHLGIGIRFSKAFQGDKLLGLIFFDHVIGKHELIDYAVALSPEGAVRQIEILEYRESYGGEIRGQRWRDQFTGKSSADKLGLNEDIYNISGATLSCRHVTEGVKRVLAIYNLLLRDQLVAAGGLPPSGGGQ